MRKFIQVEKHTYKEAYLSGYKRGHNDDDYAPEASLNLWLEIQQS
jgi:hypothetical protein